MLPKMVPLDTTGASFSSAAAAGGCLGFCCCVPGEGVVVAARAGGGEGCGAGALGGGASFSLVTSGLKDALRGGFPAGQGSVVEGRQGVVRHLLLGMPGRWLGGGNAPETTPRDGSTVKSRPRTVNPTIADAMTMANTNRRRTIPARRPCMASRSSARLGDR